ncbi:uncharacterized protein LY79DRAFT_508477 [Colletotrichum navitas]|uniref:Uncharacterized protein n=1 Tax=Colletotrichum navitas TaxID=681940 RepID=A0AAD8V7F0_9PEZI|nr:uncharacterized protein LY79DRAFT_508477 [Colletotrichum navitas]KAK1597077.1 hypothetical protein LY79DRAFT_508477 [Colletotrichum navitas]
MACAPAAEQEQTGVNMTSMWKSIDAPRSTFEVDKSTFFLPAGPTAGDRFWMVLTGGDIGHVTKNGFLSEDSGVQSSVKRKDRRKGFTFHCGTLTIDFHPSSPLRRCFVGHGATAEKRVVARLRTDCQYAADKVAICMASMLWHRVVSDSSATWRTEREVADDLKKAARALSELVEFAARFVEVMRRQYQGGGREETMPAAYDKAVKLLGLAEWHRIHRTLNAAQCMEKAFRQSAGRSASRATRQRCENFIQSNLLGMLGWRLAPWSVGSQRNVLRDGLTALDVLGATDWDCFEAEGVRARMDKSSTTVRIVKEADFAIWTQQKLMRFLRHQPLRAVDLEEARWAGKESRSQEVIHPAHLRVLRALPWVKTFDVAGHVPILRLVVLDSVDGAGP